MQNACRIDVVEIMTFKSGKFMLSSRCDLAEIMPLVTEASVLYRTVSDLPVLPKMTSWLDENLMRQSIHGTVAIEGNPLDEAQVGKILSGPERSDKSSRSEIEILNLKSAYKLLDKIKDNDGPVILTQHYIKEVHRIITEGIEYNMNGPGQYRNHRVEVGDLAHGGIHVPPKILTDIQTIMARFEEWINSKEILELHTFSRAALAHYYLGVIHPFGDGNGRTARYIEATILAHSGYKYIPKMLSNYYYKNVDEYYSVYRLAEKDNSIDITPFIRFVLNAIISSIDEIRSGIVFHIRLLVLTDYIKFLREEKNVTQRQSDLMQLLINGPGMVSSQELHSTHPFRILYRKVSHDTAKRDLKRLAGLNLLIKDGGAYKINWHVLG